MHITNNRSNLLSTITLQNFRFLNNVWTDTNTKGYSCMANCFLSSSVFTYIIPLVLRLHSSNGPGELSQWLSHDDSTIDIILDYYYYSVCTRGVDTVNIRDTVGTLLSPPDTARMLPVTDQLRCQTTSLNLCSSFGVQFRLELDTSTDQMNT